jgi:hypothetical protein
MLFVLAVALLVLEAELVVGAIPVSMRIPRFIDPFAGF